MKYISVTSLNGELLQATAYIKNGSIDSLECDKFSKESLNYSKIITALDSSDVMIDNFEYGSASKKTFLKLLPYRIESKYFIKDIIFCPLLHKTKSQVVSTSPSVLKKHLEDWIPSGVDPNIVSSSAIALWRFASHYLDKLEDLFIIHFSSIMTFISVERGEIKQSFSIASKNIKSGLEQSYKAFFPSSNIPKILLLGDYIPHIKLFSKQTIVEPPISHTFKKYALNIGLLLDQIKPNAIQFRQGVYASSQEKNSHMFKWGALISVAFISTTLFGYILNNGLDQKNEQLLHKVQTTFAYDQKAFNAKQYIPNDTNEILNLWSNVLCKQNTSANRSPQISIFISWLDKHQLIKKWQLKKVSYLGKNKLEIITPLEGIDKDELFSLKDSPIDPASIKVKRANKINTITFSMKRTK